MPCWPVSTITRPRQPQQGTNSDMMTAVISRSAGSCGGPRHVHRRPNSIVIFGAMHAGWHYLTLDWLGGSRGSSRSTCWADSCIISPPRLVRTWSRHGRTPRRRTLGCGARGRDAATARDLRGRTTPAAPTRSSTRT
ncbi:hypothetical protein QJS66_16475 [Kocuria rhizophila]|nr:hypothetical protein QJS66_16475 [Kocuria rhizophila]